MNMSSATARDWVIKQAPTLSRFNRDALLMGDVCSCYFCIRQISTCDIDEWFDNGQTGLCPNCNVDALIPNVVDVADLSAACEKWFTGNVSRELTDKITASLDEFYTVDNHQKSLRDVALAQGGDSSAFKSYACIRRFVFAYQISPWYRIDLKLRAVQGIIQEIQHIERKRGSTVNK